MTDQTLSPAAQAVRKAYYSTNDDLAGPALAAALRVAAPLMECVQDHLKLLDIAAELEGQL